MWDRVDEVRNAVLATIADVSPQPWSFVLTLALEPGHEQLVGRIAAIAATRRGRFVPIRLVCDLDGLERRVRAPGRGEAMKSTSVAEARRLFAAGFPPSIIRAC